MSDARGRHRSRARGVDSSVSLRLLAGLIRALPELAPNKERVTEGFPDIGGRVKLLLDDLGT